MTSFYPTQRSSGGSGHYEMLNIDPMDPQPRTSPSITRKPVRRSTMGSLSETQKGGAGYTNVMEQQYPKGATENSHDPKDPYKPPQTAKWGVSWKVPLGAIFLFLMGIVAAIGNHLYFASLDGQRYNNQEWVSRYGLVLAFAVKVSLVSCIDITYFQVVWYILRNRERGVSLEGIDALFAVIKDLPSFLVADFWTSAPLAAVIAVITWLLPLVAVVAPGTLGVTVANQTKFESCLVPSLDLAQNATKAFLLANSTNGTHVLPEDLAKYNYEGWYTGPSTVATKIGVLTAYQGQPLECASPCGANCSYGIQFHAPAWRCNHTDPETHDAAWWNKTGPGTPWGSSPAWYPMNASEFNDAWDPKTTDANKNYGFWGYSALYIAGTDNVTGQFWLGSAVKNQDPAGVAFFDLFDVEVFKCESWNASYTVSVTYENAARTKMNITNLEYLNNVTLAGVNFDPNYLPPSQIGLSSHKAMFDVITGLLSGTITSDPRSIAAASTGLEIYNIPTLVDPISTLKQSSSSSAPQEAFTVKHNIRGAVEQLSQNFALSFLSQPNLRYYANLAPSLDNGKCSVTRFETQWKYKPRDLVIAYAVAVAAAFVSLVLGAWIIMSNGIIAGVKFSNLVCTTRNIDLDEAVKGNCLGSELMEPQNLKKMRLRFGEVLPDGAVPGEVANVPSDGSGHGVKHAAFGMVGTVVKLEKGAAYS